MSGASGRLEVLGLGEDWLLGPGDKWRSLVRAAGADDVGYWPEYAALFAANGDGSPQLIHFQSAHGRVVYPVLLRKVAIGGRETGCCDITSPYGYSGPFLQAADAASVPDLAREFRQAMHAYCLEQRVVTEFIRYHPLLETYRGFEAEPGFESLWPTVVVDLTVPPGRIWDQSFAGRTRTAIRKARAMGVRVEQGTGEAFLANFIRLYRLTMRRVGAGAYYFFTDGFFARLGQSIGQLGTFLQAEHQGSVIASTLLLKGPRFLHYFLSGSDPAYRSVPAVDLLLHEATLWGATQGLEALHLGGGHGAAAADSLFHFKAGFSPDRRRYCVAKVIHQPAIYADLVAARFGRDGPAARFGANRPPAGFFPLYRQEE